MKNAEKLIRLENGLLLKKLKNGRYQNVANGRFVGRKTIEEAGGIPGERIEIETEALDKNQGMKEKILEVVREQGIEANSLEEVWGHLVGVQAEIAMDKNNGSKATAAAKLLSQVMGTMEGDSAKGDGTDVLVLGQKLAKEVLNLIEEFRKK